MKTIILATHGNLSFEFKKTAELIVGNTTNIKCFGMTKDKSASQGKKELVEMINSAGNTELIILTDLFGGSVTNICTELLLEKDNFELLTGLNLPMLLTLLTIDTNELKMSELISKLEHAGMAGVINVGQKVRERIGNNA